MVNVREMTVEEMDAHTQWLRTMLGLPSVDGQAGNPRVGDPQLNDQAKADRIRALELGSGNVSRAALILAFIQGESTPTLLTPLHALLTACYEVFLAQDMKDHVVVFDKVTDMRDAYGGVLRAMDELGIHRNHGAIGNVPGDGSEGELNG